MSTINEDLDIILKKIEVSVEERENAISRHTNLREIITGELDAQTELTGSYKRHTGVKPLNDVDILMWLSKELAEINKISELKLVNPKTLLERLERKLKGLNIDHDAIHIQDHSLGIRYKDEEFSIDLIPAFSSKDPKEASGFGRKFWIPEKELKTWIPSYPEKHQMLLSDANQKGNKKVVPLIKLLKAWRNRQSGKTFKSFHLEALCIYLANTKTEIFSKGKNFFLVLLEATDELLKIIEGQHNIASELGLDRDPIEYLNGDESRKQRSFRKLASLNKQLHEIQHLENNGDNQGASTLISKIFNGNGRSRRRSTRVSPEAGSKRFGHGMGG